MGLRSPKRQAKVAKCRSQEKYSEKLERIGSSIQKYTRNLQYNKMENRAITGMELSHFKDKCNKASKEGKG